LALSFENIVCGCLIIENYIICHKLR